MRLIDADKLDEKLENLAKKYAAMGRFEVAKDYSWTQTVLLSAPTLTIDDIIPHGRWIEQEAPNMDTYYDCSACGESFCLIEGSPADNLYTYCPNCGAKMLHDNPELIGGTE